MIELGHGYIEMAAQTVFQTAQDLPFVLERSGIGDVYFQGEKTDRHVRPRLEESKICGAAVRYVRELAVGKAASAAVSL